MSVESFEADLATIKAHVAELRLCATDQTWPEIDEVTSPALDERARERLASYETYRNDALRSLPGGAWKSLEEAASWFRGEREKRGWSREDVSGRWAEVVWKSKHPDSSSVRPTVKRVASFEEGGCTIEPHWLRWMPLVFMYHDHRGEDRHLWELENIPLHREWDEILAAAEEARRRPWLADHEVGLISQIRGMTDNQLIILLELARAPHVLQPIADMLQERFGDASDSRSAD